MADYNNTDPNKTITGSAEADNISNSGATVTIDALGGDDTIDNRAEFVSISGGAGNDSIYNNPDNVTINAGAGNDSIKNEGKLVLFQYSGGNDIIEGFNEACTLQIMSGTIASAYSNGTDIFLTIGSNVVTLQGLSTNVIKIKDSLGTDSEYTVTQIKGTEEADSLPNAYSGVTIQALGGNDTVDNSGDNVSIDAGKGDDSINNTGSNVKIYGGDGNDTMLVNGATVTVSNGDDTISNTGSNVTILGGVGEDSIENTGSFVSINGGADNDYININGGSGVTVNVADGNDTIYFNSDISSLTVQNFGASDVIQFSYTIESLSAISGGIKADDVTIAGLTAATSSEEWSGTTKYVEKISEGATLSTGKNSIIYNTPASETTLFTISGITSTSNITVDTEYKGVTVGAGALGSSNVSITSGYTLALAEDVSGSQVADTWIQSGTTYVYKPNSTIAGYELDTVNNVINYTAAKDGTSVVELTNINTGSNAPTVSTDSVEFSTGSFAGNVVVSSNAGNYAFKINEGNYSKKSFTGTANADSISNSGSNISINAGNGDDTISNSGATVSVNAGNGNDFIFNSGSNVTISGGAGADTVNNTGDKVTILGGNDSDSIYNTGNNVSIVGGAADDTIENGGSGVTISGDAGADYISNNGSNVLINGGADNDSIDLNSGENLTVNVASGNDTINLGNVTSFSVQGFTAGDVIQLAALVDSLGTVSGGITAGNVTVKGLGTNLSSTSNTWSLGSSAAIYSKKITAGIALTDDKDAIVSTAASTSNLFTITGVTSTVGIDVNDTIVTLSKSALGTSNISISGDDYSLALGSDVSGSQVADTWIQSGTTYAYKTKSTIAGYDLDAANNVIEYTAAKDGTTVVELTNININDNAPTVSSNSIELSTGSFSGNVSVKSNSGKYKFELAEGSYGKKTFSGSGGADSIYNDGANLNINGGAGNDFINNENTGSTVTILGGAGSDTIENLASNVTIGGEAANDSIYNTGNNVSINAGAGADSISNTGASVSINGDAGNDYISNSGNKVSIFGGAGTDSIYNDGSNVTISGGIDNDSIYNGGKNILYKYSGGNDTIQGFSATDTLQISSGSIASAYFGGDDGTDAFLTVGQNVITIKNLSLTTNKINIMDSKGSLSAYTISLVKGTDANDYLINFNSNVTIDALAGNDTITSSANSVTIAGGAGNDSIESSGNKVSINGGADNDFINISTGSTLTINTADGNDTISLKNDAAKITIQNFSSGDVISFADSISALGTISGGVTADSVTISGINPSSVSSGWSLSGSNAHYIENYSTGVVLSKGGMSITYKADGEQDTLFTVSGVKATSGLALNDSIVVISSAALNKKDITINNGYSLSLGSDVSAPKAVNEGWFKSGNNYAYKTDSTIAGYQLVSDNEINYVSASGGDTLIVLGGIKVDSNAPEISGNTVYFSPNSFNSNVTVVSNPNAYSLELNAGDYSNKTFTATSSGDEIKNYGSKVVVVSGNGNDSVENCNASENATINASAGNDYIFNYGENASINAGAGSDEIQNYANYATINAGAGNDTISNNADNILFQYGGGSDIVDGFNETSTLQISSGSISSAYIDGTDAFIALGDDILTLRGLTTNKINLVLADETVSSEYFIPVFKGTDQADLIENTNSNIMVQALAGDDTVNNSGSSVTVDAGAGDDYISNSADSVTIAGGAGLDLITNYGSKVSISGGAGNDSVELSSCSSVTVNVKDGNDTIVVDMNVPSLTVQNFTAGDRIHLNVVATSLTSTKGGVKVDNDLTINGLTASNVSNGWSLVSGVATYYQKHTAGVTLTDNNNDIVYTAAGTNDIFTIGSVGATKDITVDEENKNVTVGAGALTTANVSITSGYNLYLAEGVSATAETSAPSWYLSGTTATYRDISTLAGYTLEENQIIYTPTTYGKILAQLKGVSLPADTSSVIVSNSIALTAANFASNVTVSNNANEYVFELGDDDYSGKSFVGTSSGDFIYNYGSNIKINSGNGNDIIDNYSGNATITTGNGDDSIYTRDSGTNVKVAAGGGSDTIENDASLASIDGGAGNDYINNIGHSSTLNGGAGDDEINNNWGTNIAISGGAGNDSISNSYGTNSSIFGGAGDDYIYSMAENVTINAGDGNDTIELNLSNISENYLEYSSGEGNDVITLNGSNSAKLKVNLLSGTIGGTSTTEENDFVIQIDEGSLTFKNAGGEIISVGTAQGENYIWNGVSNTIIGGDSSANIIDNKSVYVTVQSGAGNDTVTLSADENSSNMYEYSVGGGEDVVYNYNELSTIKIAGSSKVKVKVKKDDVLLKVGSGNVNLKDAAANQTALTVVDENNAVIINDIYTTEGKINIGKTEMELAKNFRGTYTAQENITVVDGSSVMSGIKIIGNENYANSLVGGNSNDTLESTTFDDTLTGGKGSDVFVYKGGSDVLSDYEKRDKIKLENDSTVTSYAINGKDLILGLGSDLLTIAGGANKAITFLQGTKRTRNIYTTMGIFDGKEKTVTLTGAASIFSAAKYSKLATIDGAGVGAIELVGNSKKNYIIASANGSTISGGKGNDTLVGGEGADVFIYDKGGGKDVIEGFGAGDVISLGNSVEIRDAQIKGSNSVIKFAGGSLTIKDTKIATLTSGGNDILFQNGAFIDKKNSVVTVYGSYKDKINLADLGVLTADATLTKGKMTIAGDSGANSITGGTGKDSINGGAGADYISGGKGKDSLWGGAGNDTLCGGKGNDMLWGDAGSDTFIFTAGDGNDTIMGYENGELLSILNKRGKEVDVSKATFNEGKGTFSLMVKGGGKIVLSDVTSSTSVNVNGTTQTISNWVK